MNICKKIGAALMMVLMASSVSAQNAELTIDPVNIAPGEEAEIVVNYKGDMPFANIQMDITLPEGLSFVEQEYVNADDEIEYVYALIVYLVLFGLFLLYCLFCLIINRDIFINRILGIFSESVIGIDDEV